MAAYFDFSVLEKNDIIIIIILIIILAYIIIRLLKRFK